MAANKAHIQTVSVGTSSVLLLRENYARAGAVIANPSTDDLLVKFGEDAAEDDYTFIVYGESQEPVMPAYVGAVSAVRRTGASTADIQVTEVA